MEERAKWKYCAAGNIVHQHTDTNGKVLYGTAAFTGGTKVYLRGKYWEPNQKTIETIGLTRGKKYKVIFTPVELIENVRFQRVFTPAVLEIMDNYEFWDCWWHTTSKDKKEVKKFINDWNAACIARQKNEEKKRFSMCSIADVIKEKLSQR